ncbi:hypothetical protein MASR1M48_02030 [Lactococcus petauri]|uniref:hypothetical protein n=1 Tax=Lactococcus sp. bn62 TaxID=3037457 RepID=UPI0024C4D4E1|nr:hypothetical protein [Lactococcus sp. bn62]WKY24128.1 hypothetical protein P3G65_10490 [Lactococcus sp. bn62]
MKLTKKQIIVGGAVAVLLAGGVTASVVHNNNVQAEKIAQQAKDEHDKLIQSVKEKTSQAETYKSESDVKTAQDLIKQLDDKEKPDYVNRIEKVQKNWKLVNEANKNVVNAEKIQNDNNVKTAQKAIDNLKDEKIKSKKTALQTRLDKVKTSIKNTKKQKQMTSQKGLNKEKEEVAKKVDNSSQSVSANNSEVKQAQVESPTVTDPTPTDNGGVSNDSVYQPTPQTPQAPTTGGNTGSGNTSTTNPPSTGGGNTVTPPTGGGNSGGNSNTGGNNGGGTVTPPPAETFTGWVRNKEGQIVWQQGGFSSLAEAGSAATAWCNANATSGGWSSGAY